jgi:hypothetical protein
VIFLAALFTALLGYILTRIDDLPAILLGGVLFSAGGIGAILLRKRLGPKPSDVLVIDAFGFFDPRVMTTAVPWSQVTRVRPHGVDRGYGLTLSTHDAFYEVALDSAPMRRDVLATMARLGDAKTRRALAEAEKELKARRRSLWAAIQMPLFALIAVLSAIMFVWILEEVDFACSVFETAAGDIRSIDMRKEYVKKNPDINIVRFRIADHPILFSISSRHPEAEAIHLHGGWTFWDSSTWQGRLVSVTYKEQNYRRALQGAFNGEVRIWAMRAGNRDVFTLEESCRGEEKDWPIRLAALVMMGGLAVWFAYLARKNWRRAAIRRR